VNSGRNPIFDSLLDAAKWAECEVAVHEIRVADVTVWDFFENKRGWGEAVSAATGFYTVPYEMYVRWRNCRNFQEMGRSTPMQPGRL
jgi:hypothetical protein